MLFKYIDLYQNKISIYKHARPDFAELDVFLDQHFNLFIITFYLSSFLLTLLCFTSVLVFITNSYYV